MQRLRHFDQNKRLPRNDKNVQFCEDVRSLPISLFDFDDTGPNVQNRVLFEIRGVGGSLNTIHRKIHSEINARRLNVAYIGKKDQPFWTVRNAYGNGYRV